MALQAIVNASGSDGVVNGCVKSEAADLKTSTYKFTKGKTQVLSLAIITAVLNLVTTESPATGTNVRLKIEGV